MKLFLKILFFIFTMIIVTVGEIKSSTAANILQEEISYSFIQKSQHGAVLFENHNINSFFNEENAVTYCERVISVKRNVAKGEKVFNASHLDDYLKTIPTRNPSARRSVLKMKGLGSA